MYCVNSLYLKANQEYCDDHSEYCDDHSEYCDDHSVCYSYVWNLQRLVQAQGHFALVPFPCGITSRYLSVRPLQLQPSGSVGKHISLIWPFADKHYHAQWPVNVLDCFKLFVIWHLIPLALHWAWPRRGYWPYRSGKDWWIASSALWMTKVIIQSVHWYQNHKTGRCVSTKGFGLFIGNDHHPHYMYKVFLPSRISDLWTDTFVNQKVKCAWMLLFFPFLAKLILVGSFVLFI